MVESVFWPRLRWRMRGAWLWPAFGVLTVLDVALLVLLPFAGDGPNVVGGMLLALFFNLVVVAVGAPLAGMVLRARRRDLPRMVARDYAGTALLVLVTAGLAAGGLAHRAGLRAERSDRAAALAAVRAYVGTAAPRFSGGAVDLLRMERDRYRGCVYGPSRLPLCVFVRTDQRPAGVTRDPDRTPNQHS